MPRNDETSDTPSSSRKVNGRAIPSHHHEYPDTSELVRAVEHEAVVSAPDWIINTPDATHSHELSHHPVARCAVFVEGHKVDGPFTIASAIERVRQENSQNSSTASSSDSTHGAKQRAFVWVSLISPTIEHMEPIARLFHLHSLTVEDIVQAQQRPKLEILGDYVFIVARTVHYDPSPVDSTNEFIETNELHIIRGNDFVITIRHGHIPIPDDVRHRLERSPQLTSVGPASVAYALLDWIVDDYLHIAEDLEEKVDTMEDEVFTPGSPVHIEPIYMLKRENLEMRHVLDPMTAVLKTLTVTKGISGKTVRSLYRDILDHHTIAADRIISYDERLSTLLDSAVAKVSLQQNTDMRKISACAAMAAVPTLIAGVYGMNFDNMPETHWADGYYIVLIVMLSACIGLWLIFRRNKWL